MQAATLAVGIERPVIMGLRPHTPKACGQPFESSPRGTEKLQFILGGKIKQNTSKIILFSYMEVRVKPGVHFTFAICKSALANVLAICVDMTLRYKAIY